MTTLKRFEDLYCWQSARELVNMVYEATNDSPFHRDFGLRDQMSNIAGGVNGGTDAEFMRFLSFSRRSISEVQSQAYIALDQEYIHQDTSNNLYNKANEAENRLTR